MTTFAGIIYPDVLQVSDLIDEMLAVLQHRSQGARYTHSFKNIQWTFSNQKSLSS
jgi:hypothetical protein